MLAIVVAAMLASAAVVPAAAPLPGCALEPLPIQATIVRQADLPAANDVAPSQWVVIGPSQTERGSELVRAGDGLFYVTGIVNGAPVRFLVDTGASTIVLTAEDAARAGLKPGEDHFADNADTANGRTQMARVTIDDLAVGQVRSRQISAAVVRDGLGVSLLGQNWLSQLASLTISGDRMILR